MSTVTRRTSALAGLVIAPLWIGVTALLTWLEWDYLRSVGWGPTTANEVPYPSVLLRGDFGLVQSANFVVTGVLVAVFALGLRREFPRRISGWVATVGFAIFSLGTIMNAGTTDLGDEPATLSGTVHVIGFGLVLFGALLAYPASGLALRGNPAWRRLAAARLVAGPPRRRRVHQPRAAGRPRVLRVRRARLGLVRADGRSPAGRRPGRRRATRVGAVAERRRARPALTQRRRPSRPRDMTGSRR